MEHALVITADTVIVICGIIATILSILIIQKVSDGGITYGWWILLPIVMGWSTLIRILIMGFDLDIFTEDGLRPAVAAMQVVFYIGITVFLYGLLKVTNRLTETGGI